jgi:hypothetical protein
MGVAVMMGMVVGMGMRHGRTLYYNITGVYEMAVLAAPPAPGHRAGLLALGIVAATSAATHPLILMCAAWLALLGVSILREQC